MSHYAVLYQRRKESSWRPALERSRLLFAHILNYTNTEKEALESFVLIWKDNGQPGPVFPPQVIGTQGKDCPLDIQNAAFRLQGFPPQTRMKKQPMLSSFGRVPNVSHRGKTEVPCSGHKRFWNCITTFQPPADTMVSGVRAPK